MKKTCVAAVMLLLVSLAFANPYAEKAASGRLVSGEVMDRDSNPLPNAVVYSYPAHHYQFLVTSEDTERRLRSFLSSLPVR